MMGLKPWEFWALQPHQFGKMVDAYSKKQQHDQEQQLELAAFLVASIYNMPAVYTMDVKYQKRKEYRIEDFTGKKRKRERKVQTPEEMLAQVKMINRALGGKGDYH